MFRFSYLVFLLLGVLCFVGCGKGGGPTGPQFVATTPALADFANLKFDSKLYLADMEEVVIGEIWLARVKGAILPANAFLVVRPQENRFLVETKKIAPTQLQETLSETLSRSLQAYSNGSGLDSKSLTVQAMVVEANPGSRVARYLIGIMGAGKASVTVVVEVFEPGQAKPSLRLVAKGSLAKGDYGGDSSKLLQAIIEDVTTKLAEHLLAQLSGE